EEERGWLYLGLAIRMVIDLHLHLPNTAQPLNEAHAREMLNQTRYGKAPTIPNSDYMANYSWDWWGSSPFAGTGMVVP
ncbi:hypothetical protein K438DRAFT_1642491, partial [Mycena galopus ATCC 62051]